MQIMNGFHYYYSKSSLSYDANKGVSWIDYDKLGNPIRVQFTDHSITEHVYAADGRNKEPHPNPLPRRGNSIISSHLPLREIREGYSTIQQNTNYYPYGGMTYISTNQGEQQFKYNGKEYDPMHGLNEYDYGARHYDPAIGKFTTIDPLCEKYYHISPYAYCGGNPVNAVDVDGNLIVFINGWNYGNRGKMYWEGFDKMVMNHFHDNHAKYYDGSIGGIFNWLSTTHGQFITKDSHNINPEVRYNSGYKQGTKDVENIIKSLKRNKDGVITETMRLVTHSMGAAYGKGYSTAIMDYVAKHPKETQGFKLIEYDFAPYQPESQRAVKGVITYQYAHSDDLFRCYKHIPGAKMMKTNQEGGHLLKGFLNYISELPTGEDNIRKNKEKMQ